MSSSSLFHLLCITHCHLQRVLLALRASPLLKAAHHLLIPHLQPRGQLALRLSFACHLVSTEGCDYSRGSTPSIPAPQEKDSAIKLGDTGTLYARKSKILPLNSSSLFEYCDELTLQLLFPK